MLHHLESERFEELAREQLGKDSQRAALARATTLIGERRSAAVAELPEWEALRTQAAAIKDEVIGRLDEHLERFAERLEEIGCIVHWARDHDEACAAVAGIAKQVGAETIAKSKSMVTEEIGLNAALEKEGYRPVETDLGEWIIQLAHEPPSHIIAPAIHKTKEDVGALFARELAVEETHDIDALTNMARSFLRRTFAAADLGVSGVNFAVAETGTILILENEGNARLTTSLPRTHVALMGIEKVIPRFCDLEVFLRLLPRSGTGQTLTSYQSLLTGVDPDEGPDQLHIVILDNGRAGMLAEDITRQSLACIRCGACLNSCPVYKEIGGHAYGSVYPGPIGAVITPQLSGVEKAHRLPFASSLCGACRDVCPVKIDLPALLLHLRARIVERRGLPHSSGASPPLPRRLGKRITFRLWAWAMAGPRRYRFATWLGRRLARHPRLARRLAPLAAWSQTRELPRPALRPFRNLWAQRERGGRP